MTSARIRLRVLPNVPGHTPEVTIGTVTTLAFGQAATVANVGVSPDVILNFGIPQGESGITDGDKGDIVVSANAATWTIDPNVLSAFMRTVTAAADAATALATLGAQPLDATLTALAAFNTNGLLTQTAADTFTGRTLTGPAAGISVSNGDGVAGNPTLALANDLAALEALSGTATIYYRSGVDTWTAITVGTGLSFSAGTLDISPASQAQMEAASSTAIAVTPGRQHYHPSALKAWVNFNGTGTIAIRASYNVSSITDGGAGFYTVNFTTAFSSAAYGYTVSAGDSANALPNPVIQAPSATPTASAFAFKTAQRTDGAATDYDYVSAKFAGDQ